MTRDELAGRISRNVNSTGVFYTPADLNDAIQDGYDEIVGLTGCIHKATTIAFTANLTYYDFGSLISDFAALVAIWNTTTKRWLLPVSEKYLERERDDWETATGTPEYFYPVNFRYVAIYRKPSSAGYGNMYVFYKALADTLEGDDTPSIPHEYVQTLEEYVTTDMFEQQREWVKANDRMKAYLEQLKELKTQVMMHRIPARTHVLLRG